MKLLFRLIVASVMLSAITGYVYFSDGGRYKADLEAYLSEISGYKIGINGEIEWLILPALGLSAQNIRATDASEDISIGKLTLNAHIDNIFAALESWQIHRFVLEDVKVESEGSKMILSKLILTDFSPDTASPFVADLAYVRANPEASRDNFNLNGLLTFTALERSNSDHRIRVRFADTVLKSAYATGICSGEVTDNIGLGDPIGDDDNALLPVDSILAFNAEFNCELNKIDADGFALENGNLTFGQTEGKGEMSLSFDDFFGGKFQTTASVNANLVPIAWDISLNGSDIDSRKLFALTENKLKWQAPLSVEGNFKMLGNTEKTLTQSVIGSANFNGGQGSINVSQFKKAIILVNQLVNADKPVAELPDQLQYNNLTVAWTIQGEANTLVVALDNLQAKASGSIQFLTGNLSLSGEALIHTPKPGQQIRLTPILLDTAIPFNCEGKLDEPACKPNTKAVGKMLIQILKNSQQGKVKEKLDKVIEEQVPEQFKDAAKQLLNLFGR